MRHTNLAFVHIVPAKEIDEPIPSNIENKDLSEEEENNFIDSSSEEEFEFE